MPYKYETQWSTPATAFTKGRPSKPNHIVIHHYGDDSATYESSVAWLVRPDAKTSAHYVVDTGRVACIVDPDDTAWHAGDWPTNQRAVGIENHPLWSPARERTLVELCADLHETYGNMTYSVHRTHTQTECPGRWAARLPHIIGAVNAELATRKRAKTAKSAGYVHVPGVKAYHVVRKGDTVSALARYYGNSVSNIIRYNKLGNAAVIHPGQKLRVR